MSTRVNLCLNDVPVNRSAADPSGWQLWDESSKSYLPLKPLFPSRELELAIDVHGLTSKP